MEADYGSGMAKVQDIRETRKTATKAGVSHEVKLSEAREQATVVNRHDAQAGAGA